MDDAAPMETASLRRDVAALAEAHAAVMKGLAVVCRADARELSSKDVFAEAVIPGLDKVQAATLQLEQTRWKHLDGRVASRSASIIAELGEQVRRIESASP